MRRGLQPIGRSPIQLGVAFRYFQVPLRRALAWAKMDLQGMTTSGVVLHLMRRLPNRLRPILVRRAVKLTT